MHTAEKMLLTKPLRFRGDYRGDYREDLWVHAQAAAAGPNTLSGLASPGRRIVAAALNGYGGTTLDVSGGPIAAHAAAIDAVFLWRALR
ncbi:MAG: hypothetical protein NT133_19060 [Alphaproteobacteria bacterium]|nr:hypothetical protein [Alphaproteobacteria bacterium]